ncbi:MAG: acetyl-CoA carboxylase biotin carboxyl carrier protein [Pseudobutyrivibrio sp.]|nr:acetyl-CoA carboxylase biotin carboxyl carrier protein [Pseudobutyrivibrio sp.]
MDIQEIKDLLRVFDDSDSVFLEVESGDTKIKVKKASAVECTSQLMVPAAMAETKAVKNEDNQDSAPSTEEGELVKAPLVGVFYAAPSPEEVSYVQVGDRVKEGQTLCLIEAMKMMSEITAPRDGVIKEIFVKNQDMVEFDQALFRIG